MKTKHLFFAAALMTSFAACTSEDVMMGDMQMPTSSVRPVVDDVKLNFGATDAQTRVIYDSEVGYQWQSTDKIGALLMDELNPYTATTPWQEKYTLVNYIHTSFPFTYSDGSWGSETKMLEGNYFFASPWEDYDGNRQVSHSLLNQQQTGVAASVRAKSYADNQFFVGYSQIKAVAAQKGDFLNNNTVEMTPVLGAIQLQIKNNGTQTYKINKVVLSGNNKIASAVTIDPTNAYYAPYNTEQSYFDKTGAYVNQNNVFNFANYMGEDEKKNPIYNADENYKKTEAIRAIVKPVATVEKSAQLTINGSDEDRSLKHDGSTAYVLIMCNPFEIDKSAGEVLNLSIYTNKGMVPNIDLSEIHAKHSDYKVVTTSKVTEIGINTVNTIGIHLDDNSFIVPEEMDIYNSSDLEQYIKWNNELVGTHDVKVALKQDVVINKKIAAMLAESKNTTLEFIGTGGKLILDTDVPANFLDSKRVKVNDLGVEVRGTLALTKDTKGVKSITVAEGAALTIGTGTAVIPANIYNNGTISMSSEAAVKSTTTIYNYKGGVITLSEDGDSKAYIYNEDGATVNNDGFMLNVENKEGGVINMGQGAMLDNSTNEGTIMTAGGSKTTVTGSSKGEVVYVHNATISVGNNTISTKYAGGTVDDDSFDEKDVTKLILTGGETKLGANKTFTTIVVEATASINTNGKTLTVGTLTVEAGKATLDGTGAINITTAIVKEGAVLENNTTVNLTTDHGVFTNFGTVYNNSKIEGTNVTWNQEPGSVWKYNDLVNYPTPGPKDPEADDVRDAAIKAWVGSWSTATFQVSYYDEKDDVENFAKFVETTLKNGNAAQKKIYDDYVTFGDKKVENKTQEESIVAALTAEVEVTEGGVKVKKVLPTNTFITSVDKNLSTAKLLAALKNKNVLKNEVADAIGTNGFDAKLYDSQAEAYDEFQKMLNVANNNFWPDKTDETFWTKAVVTAEDAATQIDNLKAVYTFSATKLTDADIQSLLATHSNAKYAYIWDTDDCPLNYFMDEYMTYSPDVWDVAFRKEGIIESTEEIARITNMTTLKEFFLAASLATESSTVLNVAKALVTKYTSVDAWKYTDEQFANYPVQHKGATIEKAKKVVDAINLMAGYGHNTQKKLMDKSEVKEAVKAFSGNAYETVEDAEIAIAIAETAGAGLSAAAELAWAHTPDVVLLADAFVTFLTKNMTKETKRSEIMAFVNGKGSTNTEMTRYWNGLNVVTGEKHDFTETQVQAAIDVVSTSVKTGFEASNAKIAWANDDVD